MNTGPPPLQLTPNLAEGADGATSSSSTTCKNTTSSVPRSRSLVTYKSYATCGRESQVTVNRTDLDANLILISIFVEYQLVAGGEELADVSPPAGSPIKLEDHWSHGLIPMEFDDTDGYSSTSASPDFSPPDFQNQYLPSPDHPATRQLDMASAAHYSTDPRNIASSASSYSPSFTHSTPEYSSYGRISSRTPPTDAAPASEYPKAHHPLNRIRALRLTADGMSPLFIRMDQLVPLNMPYQPLQLKICLRISTLDDINCPSTLQGFLANVYLSHMWTSSGKCITKTIVGGTTVAEDIDSLQVSEVNMGTVNALLPESHLSRCRWLEPSTYSLIPFLLVGLHMHGILMPTFFRDYRCPHQYHSRNHRRRSVTSLRDL